MNKFVDEYPFSYNLIISQMIYAFPITMMNDIDLYLNLIKEIETFEENGKYKSKFIDVFKDFLLSKDTQESSYILENMVKKKFIELNHSQVLHNLYFAHYVTEEELKIYFFDMCMNEVQKLFDNYDELSKNNWKLHKKLIEEGHNPNKILKIIRNDEIEKFQKISSQTNFNIDQEVVPSLYERCSFINQYGVKLIDYAAFFGSIKCFKYLLLNGANLSNTSKYAIASGNLEIIHICEQNNSSFKDAYETAIKFHKNDIFKYIYENKLEKINLEEIGIKCILYHNYEIFSFLLEEGMEIHDSIINESAKIGNIFLLKHFLNEYHIPNDILIFSVESGNIELVQYVLEQKM